MTVSSTSNRVSFAGDALTTSFGTTPVIFFNSSELVVIVVTDATGAENTLVENTDYTVTGGSGATGTVDTSGGSAPYGAPAVGETLVILRTLPITQAVDLVNNDILDAEVIEDALDKLTMQNQQQQEEIGRALLLPTGSSLSDIEVPSPTANYLLGWNSTADGLENKLASDLDLTVISAFVATIVDDSTAKEVRQTIEIDLKASDVASASTIDLDAVSGDLVDVTGTTTITAITLAEGLQKTVRFTGALTLTNGASLVLLGGANITTAAGDMAIFRGYASGVVRMVTFFPAAVVPGEAFASGTKMLFVQTAAPTGWTKDTTHNDKALRVVSGAAGTGGTVAFETAFASQTPTGTNASVSPGSTDSATLSEAQLAVHDHPPAAGFTTFTGDSSGGSAIAGGDGINGMSNTGNAGSGSGHTHGHSTTHTHTFTGDAINLDVSFVDVIIATKD